LLLSLTISCSFLVSDDLPFRSSEISYPEDCLLIDNIRGLNLLLGDTIGTFFENYEIQEKELLAQFDDPVYEFWRIQIDTDLSVNYNTYSNTVNFIITKNSNFSTSRNISVGNTNEDVISRYGQPSYSYTDELGRVMFIYASFIPEINNSSQYTSVIFIFSENRVDEIALSIESGI
jgi:hypothetical protein